MEEMRVGGCLDCLGFGVYEVVLVGMVQDADSEAVRMRWAGISIGSIHSIQVCCFQFSSSPSSISLIFPLFIIDIFNV